MFEFYGFAVIRSISEPFDGGGTVEVKVTLQDPTLIAGELYLRMSSQRAATIEIGQIIAVQLRGMVD